MSWLLIDDQFHCNRKIIRAGLAGAGLYARSLSYCAAESTDGWIPREWATEIGSKQTVKLLVDVGLWIRVDSGDIFLVEASSRRRGNETRVEVPGPGFFVPDYLCYNPSRSEVLEMKQQRSAAGRKGADSKWYGKRHGKSYGKTMPPTPTPYIKNNHYVGPLDVTSKEDAEKLIEQVSATFRDIA